ncbi:DUF2284 domain-containing protein [Promethearchaeum syntrophicum]|uniref:DUF2284 domain-containing protein n=1 Tax=Promethearchaeum syntrophicum TaxID=2594042 RepID=A0A5B9D7I0_9ARCH
MVIKAYKIQFDQIVFASDEAEVQKNCQTPYKNHPNGCPNYKNNWSCPPYAPTVQKTQQSLENYRFFWMLVLKTPIPKINTKFLKKWKIKRVNMRITKTLNNYLSYLQSNHRDWKFYYCSECNLCSEKNYSKCTCPTDPCRFPNKFRISPEAAGIDVFASLKKINILIEMDPITNLQRIGMCATDENVDFAVEYKKFENQLSILNKIDSLGT